MATRPPFAEGEWYHCYNRGVDKRRTFDTARDYERFMLLLYVANSNTPIHLSNLRKQRLAPIVSDIKIVRGSPLVEIGGYCLMPNHVHLLLKEIQPGGIALFMQKVFTGYTMYFNKKRRRTGALFAGSFKSKHISNDRYLKRALAYIHLNPAELADKQWKLGTADRRNVKKLLDVYEYSSLQDFAGKARPHRTILGQEIFDLYDSKPSLAELVDEAQLYYLDSPAARFNLAAGGFGAEEG